MSTVLHFIQGFVVAALAVITLSILIVAVDDLVTRFEERNGR